MSKEALKLALEALQEVYWSSRSAKHDEAITALREALAEQPAQTDWEAVAADQALTIALLKSELQEFANKEADALEVALTESGWMWDGDQWQRPLQQESVKVGRITDNIKGMVLRQEVMLYTDDYLPIGTALYTSPPAQRTWVGLTDEEMQACWNDTMATPEYSREGIYRAIEAKLKEKNT